MNVRVSLAVVTTALVVSLVPGFGLAGPAAAQGRPPLPPRPELGRPGQEPPVFARGQVLVKFKPGAAGQQVAEAHRQNGGRAKEVIGDLDVHVVEVPAGQEKARVAGYGANPNVEFAELNGLYYAVGHLLADPPITDPKAGQQWQYHNTGQTGGKDDADIDAFDAWHVTAGSTSVAIAILDTGIDQSHEDLKTKLAKNANFTSSDTVGDRYGHGTHVAGSAAAITNNNLGVAGTCPNCVLYNVKVLGDDGSGAWSWIANGINWATDNGAKVISMSLGGYSSSRTLQLAVDRAWKKGAILVAAAGNDGKNWGSYPAAYTNVIAVAATDHQDLKASWSNYGGNWVDVAAPGANILSTVPNHGYEHLNGTSMATPHVAGLAGLVWSKGGLCGTNTCVRDQIQKTAQKIDGTGTASTQYWIHGRVNACRAVGGTCS